MDILQVALQRARELERQLDELKTFVRTYQQLQAIAESSGKKQQGQETAAGASPSIASAERETSQSIVNLTMREGFDLKFSGGDAQPYLHSATLRARLRGLRDAVPKRTIIEGAVEEILKEQSPLHISAILQRLKDLNVEVGGEDPARNLSVYLSRSNRFDSSRQEGWYLKEQKEEAPTSDGNPSGAS